MEHEQVMVEKTLLCDFQGALDRARNILLVSDSRADGDSLGSVTALAHHLVAQNKRACIFVGRPVTPTLQFLLPGHELLIGEDALTGHSFDLIITCDFSSPEQSAIGSFLERARRSDKQQLVVIDHHATNTHFGDINIVVPDASANTEVLFFIFKYFGWKIEKPIAESLLTGLLYDTGNFSNASTTHSTLKMAAELMLCGAKLHKITSMLQRNKSVDVLRFWGQLLLRLRPAIDQSLAVTFATLNDFSSHGLGQEALEGLANFLNSLADTDAIMVLKEEESTVKGSLRTTKDSVDVSKMARLFGGGGHRKAAGFTLSGKLQETKAGCRVV